MLWMYKIGTKMYDRKVPPSIYDQLKNTNEKNIQKRNVVAANIYFSLRPPLVRDKYIYVTSIFGLYPSDVYD